MPHPRASPIYHFLTPLKHDMITPHPLELARRCTTRQTLRELDSQGTVLF